MTAMHVIVKSVHNKWYHSQ